MLSALFLAGSTITFHPGDQAVYIQLPWYDILGPAARDAVAHIQTPFGLLGARVGSFFVRSFLGFPSLLLFSAVFYWGLSLFRSKSLKSALIFFLYSVLMSLDLAAMGGLTPFAFSDLLAGYVGRMLAEMFSTLLGATGAWALLLAIAAVPSFYLGRTMFSRVSAGVAPAAALPSRLFSRIGNVFRALGKKKNEPAAVPAAIARPAEASVVPPPAPERLEGNAHLPYSTPALFSSPSGVSRDDGVELVVQQATHETEADLDDRKLKVKTKDRDTYRIPSIDLLEKGPEGDGVIDEVHLAESKRRLLEKLSIYKIEVKRIQATVGPRVTLFEMELAPDVKVSRVTALENDLAMALAARGIRIIAPIPGKNAVGVEIPNSRPETVMLRSVLQVEKFKNSPYTLPIVLGKTISNEVYIDDLTAMPHLLIAGSTGSGKSVGINVILSSLLYSCTPDKVKFVLIDPKRVELFHYQHLKNHFLLRFPGFDEQIVTEPQKAVYALKCVEKEMELRYIRLEQAGVRNIGDFNRSNPIDAMYYIVVVIDELADLMITAGRDVEEPITRLAQLARAVGIHLIVATQRPSVDIITGIIKANFPSRIAFQVASKVDSRTILDGSGAEQLLGDGDMLYQPSSLPKAIRLQGPYVSAKEVEAVTRYIGSQHALTDVHDVLLPKGEMRKRGSSENGAPQSFGAEDEERDPAFDEAARLVVMSQQGSTSLLQRRLRLGFSRAGRVMDQLEKEGIVGPQDGSRARDVLIADLSELEVRLNAPPEEDY
ncbi:FtsK/SpoIIIE family protein [Pelodictyon luteolum DSM 273]|uniref:FtsK/SpoIIIE family protein n=2 Tax=Pelodictyon luteolum TaxID=1100 RepID=Q3B5U6_CHLL3|nr:FtsK/SpoIIIE family protein [Pelodictyon luteolum DSM 273]